jgi:hypothetical protein
MAQLDEALDFNGNIIFGAIGNACIGCTAWQRSFNVMARWSLTMACMSQWFCWAPWAFQESIGTVHNGKSELCSRTAANRHSTGVAVAAFVSNRAAFQPRNFPAKARTGLYPLQMTIVFGVY